MSPAQGPQAMEMAARLAAIHDSLRFVMGFGDDARATPKGVTDLGPRLARAYALADVGPRADPPGEPPSMLIAQADGARSASG